MEQAWCCGFRNEKVRLEGRPLNRMVADAKTGDAMDIQGEGAFVPTMRYKKPMMFNMKLLHELEEWINANVAGH